MRKGLLKSFYKGKKVFVTGHTGFKGSWLLHILEHLGARIKGYALEPLTREDLYNVSRASTKCDSTIGDIRDRSRFVEEVSSFEPDLVFHLAAQPLVLQGYAMPVLTYETNVIGTLNLLEGIRGLQKNCCSVIVTTDKVYENLEWDYPYREIDRLGGHDPYSSSKACSEILCQSYFKSYLAIDQYNKPLVTTRAGNVIGGGDWAEKRIIPDIVRALSANKPIELRNPKSVRPWQHVIEPLVGYMTLGMQAYNAPNEYHGAWNFGPVTQHALSVLELAQRAVDAWGAGKIHIDDSTKHQHETSMLRLDISKSVRRLDWRPKWTDLEAIDFTITWYQQYLQSPDRAEEITMNQIYKYFG